MNARLLFYLCLSLIILGSSAVIYRMFFYSPSSSVATRSASSRDAKNGGDVKPEKYPGMRLTESLEESKNSIWADPRLLQKQKLGGEEFTKNASVQNQLDNLMLLLRQGNDAEFMKQVKKLIAENPNAPEFPAVLTDYYYNHDEWPQAEQSLKNLIRVKPDNLYFQATLGDIQSIQGNYDDALKTVNTVLDQQSDNLSGLIRLLSISEMKGDLASAQQKIDNLYENNPTDGNFAIAKAEVLLQQGRLAERDQVIQKALVENPQNSELQRLAANDALTKGNADEAYRLSQIAFQNDKSNEQRVQSMKIATMAAIRKNDLSAAEEAVKKILEIRPGDKEATAKLEAIRKGPAALNPPPNPETNPNNPQSEEDQNF